MALNKDYIMTRGKIIRNDHDVNIQEYEGQRILFASDRPITLVQQTTDCTNLSLFLANLIKIGTKLELTFGFVDSISNLFDEDYLLDQMEKFNFGGKFSFNKDINSIVIGDKSLYDIIWGNVSGDTNEVLIYMEITSEKGD